MSVTNLHVVSMVASPSCCASDRTDGATPCAEKTMRPPCPCASERAWTVGKPSRAISLSTLSLWTTWPRIAPACPFFAAMRTSLSATRTPAQNPYFSARTTSKGDLSSAGRGRRPRSVARAPGALRSALRELHELDLRRDHLHDAVALPQLEALSTAPDDRVVAREEDLVALVALEAEDGALLVLAEDRRAGGAVVLRELDAEDSATRAGEDRHLVRRE